MQAAEKTIYSESLANTAALKQLADLLVTSPAVVLTALQVMETRDVIRFLKEEVSAKRVELYEEIQRS